MFFRIILPCLAIFATAISGCSGRATTANNNLDSVSTETVEIVVSPEMLPDTVYPSASVIKYSVTIVDSLVDGKLDSTSDIYDEAPGMLTFRGNGFRSRCTGTVTGEPSELIVDWCFETDEDFTETDYGKWGGGTGWTGQPVYVEWPDSIAKRFKALGVVDSSFSGREVMVGSLCRNVYFLDFVSGMATRPAVYVGNPVKGSMSLDPSLNGNLYFGQGVPAERPFGAGVIDLWRDTVTQFTPEDPDAWRGWNAYDASPLRVGQFLFRAGENGTIYKYAIAQGVLNPHSTLRYTIGGYSPGIEASMSRWLNRGYIADNHGNIICIDLNTLRPVWHFAMGDDTDCTPVMAEEDDGTYVYVGAEVDRKPDGPAVFVKLDALDGSLVWRQEFDALPRDTGSKHFDGGFFATSLLGSANCSHLVYNSCVLNTDNRTNGVFVAMDRSTGSVVYTVDMPHYGWMSPVGFVSDNGRFYVVTGDSAGYLTLLDGVDGREITRKRIGANFESSPAVVGNSLVVGSRGKTICKVSLK